MKLDELVEKISKKTGKHTTIEFSATHSQYHKHTEFKLYIADLERYTNFQNKEGLLAYLKEHNYV